MKKVINMQYTRNELDFKRGTFRVPLFLYIKYYFFWITNFEVIIFDFFDFLFTKTGIYASMTVESYGKVSFWFPTVVTKTEYSNKKYKYSYG